MHVHPAGTRRLRAFSLTMILALCFTLVAGSLSAAAPGGNSNLPPMVRRTPNQGPTGYTVTFRYQDPTATRVQIKGEWLFNTPAGAKSVSPEQWVPGSYYSGAVVADMESRGAGLWTYTTPLPSGVFSYSFYVNCNDPKQAGCTQISDPSNPPWNEQSGVVQGSIERTSQVYVPSDPRYGTVDYSWLGPTLGAAGKLTSVIYPSPTHVAAPVGQNYTVVYTPAGYDPSRATPYPTLYLSHGGGGNEVDWSTQGALPNIMDNLIFTGQIQPMVVVMINYNGFGLNNGQPGWVAPVANDIITNLIPFIEANYNVSKQAAGRAFAGLSYGGTVAQTLLWDYTSAFGYYGLFSPGPGAPTAISPEQAATFGTVGIFVGGGYQEPLAFSGMTGPRTNAVTAVKVLSDAGIAVVPDFMNGTHSWYVWRTLLKDFLTHTAFWTLPDQLN